MTRTITALLLADSHIGFDHAVRPKVARRRRGHDFLANLRRAARIALEADVDLVVHGGDVFHRSRPPAQLVVEAYEPLLQLADAGLPVFVVPGNHERSRLPKPLLLAHPHVHVFAKPRAFELEVRGVRVAVNGFPFRRRVGDFGSTSAAAEEVVQRRSELTLLCAHQAVEGATVGAHDFVFRAGVDVIPGESLPRGVAAVLSGHIHRHQVLRHDLAGRELPCPVVYPGSLERTSITERLEAKGIALLRFVVGRRPGGELVDVEFVELPSRPMVDVRLAAEGQSADVLVGRLRELLGACPDDAIVTLRFEGQLSPSARLGLTADRLRRLAPPTMNIEAREVVFDA